MKVSIYTPESHTMITPLPFIVNVGSNELTATIVEIIDHPVDNQFVVKFSDGYKDSFKMTEDGNVVPGNWESGKAYAAAIEEDMQVLGLLSNNELVWTLRLTIEGKQTNVWIRRSKRDEGICYSVYYNRDYYFHVKLENNQWISETSRKIDPQPINQDVAAEVIKLVAYYHIDLPN